MFHFLGGCDINAVSAATYSRNFGTKTVCEDILKIAENEKSIKTYLEAIGFDANKPTVVIGCAPCQGFSSHRKKHWDSEDDERNNLVIAFSRIIAQISPDAFLMENVPEFLSQRYWRYFSKARESFYAAGYTVKQNIYNAAEFGVPQERFRSIIVGMRKNFLLPESYLNSENYRTVRDAIGDLPKLVAGEKDPSDQLHRAVSHKKSTIDVIKKVPHDGGNLPDGEGPKCLTRVNGFYDVYGRLSWDRPAITITHYARNPASGRYTHPVQDRGLTAREAARLQSFPDGFQFEGKSDDIYRQIGEAVPPLLSCGVAVDVLIELLSKEPTANQLKTEVGVVELPVSNSYSSVIAGIKNTRRKA
jgi:DNA (cytosine-5)-methyltransferase 1